MLPSMLYVVVRLLLDLAMLRCQSDAARDLEPLAAALLLSSRTGMGIAALG